MKSIFFNCKLFVGLWRYFTGLFSKLLCFIKKRKLSTQEQVYTNNMPTSIQIQGEKSSEEIKLVDWNTWGDEKPQEEDHIEKEIPAEMLFKDMEPVINKAKMVHVKKKVKVPTRPPAESPFAFQSKTNNLNYNGNSMNFKAHYQVESELGSWVDEPSGWDNEIDDNEISKQSDNMIKQTKQLQRERRNEEQKRKRLEKEQLKAQRKTDGHIGVKIS